MSKVYFSKNNVEALANKILPKLHSIDSTAQLVYAEKLGLGSRRYELINIDQ